MSNAAIDIPPVRGYSATVFVRPAKWLLVALLALTLGLHWAFLQSVAWVGMAISYSQDAPLGVALTKTFDGRHPCKICVVVAEGKKDERRQNAGTPDTRLDFLTGTCSISILPQSLAPDMERPLPRPLANPTAPDYPPPRAA